MMFERGLDVLVTVGIVGRDRAARICRKRCNGHCSAFNLLWLMYRRRVQCKREVWTRRYV
jgi:hypothetical protein